MQLGASFLLAHVFDWRVGAALWLLLLPLKNQLTKSKRQCAAGSVGCKNCDRKKLQPGRLLFGRFTALSHVCSMELLNDVLANVISAVIISAGGYIVSWAFKKNPFQ